MNFFRESKGFKIVIFICIILLCILGISYKLFQDSQKKDTITSMKREKPSVMVVPAASKPVMHFIPTVGELKPNDQVALKAEIDGKIVKINFTEGSYVKKGDVLLKFDDTRAAASLRESQANLEKAKSEYEPASKLANQGVGPKMQSNVKKAEVDVCIARVDQYNDNLSKHTIVAPFDGVVGLKDISEGEFIAVNQNRELVKVVDCQPLKIDFYIPEGYYRDVKVDSPVYAIVTDFTGRDIEYKAIIKAIDPISEKASRSFKARAVIDNSTNTLKPGMFVKLNIPIRANKNGILIPESAIQSQGDTDRVWIVADEKAIGRTVITGVKKDGLVEILSGVSAGEWVITHGHEKVYQDNVPVKIVTNDFMYSLSNAPDIPTSSSNKNGKKSNDDDEDEDD